MESPRCKVKFKNHTWHLLLVGIETQSNSFTGSLKLNFYGSVFLVRKTVQLSFFLSLSLSLSFLFSFSLLPPLSFSLSLSLSTDEIQTQEFHSREKEDHTVAGA